MFRRKVEKQILENLRKADSKILVIDGARQIGKSFIVRETAKPLFKHYIEINLRDDKESKQYFDSIQSIEDFYLQVSSLYGDNLGNFDDTLIFLDEIQEYPNLLTLLKPLKMDRRYRFVCSGSLLGVTLKHVFIPMGSIDEIRMYPMDFEEFLWAHGVGKDVISFLKNSFQNLAQVPEGLHKTMLRYFKEYLISGGLPDAVKALIVEQNIMQVRKIQEETFNYYKDDAAKYDKEHTLKVRRIYDSIVSYMDNKVKRIQFNKIDENYNRGHYEEEFDYLISSGIALDTKAVANPIFPLVESSSKNLIKLYYNDVGLLTNLLYRNNIKAILNVEEGANLGSVYETVVAMELKAHGHVLYYFDSKKMGEVDFLTNDYELGSVLPIEVKSGNDQNNFRAIPKLVDKEGNYKLKKGIILGNKNMLEEKGDLFTLPIYMTMFI